MFIFVYNYLHDKKLYKDLFFIGVVKLSFFFENLIQVKFYSYLKLLHLIKRKLNLKPKYIIIFDIIMQALKLL